MGFEPVARIHLSKLSSSIDWSAFVMLKVFKFLKLAMPCIIWTLFFSLNIQSPSHFVKSQHPFWILIFAYPNAGHLIKSHDLKMNVWPYKNVHYYLIKLLKVCSLHLNKCLLNLGTFQSVLPASLIERNESRLHSHRDLIQ